MAYRGDDLDLRTPQSWSSGGREAGAGEQANWWTRTAVYKGGRTDPIWVDDYVMACCNHAYDLALAHRASEVRLEHLINALTLNDHAAQVLEARGLSVASLRRESGAAIANDIPASTSSALPKRSEGMEEALRLAADHAYPRRTPVTVDDILHVLFDMKRDLPGLQLLRRHANVWSGSGRNGPEQRAPDLRLDPLPHLSRPQPTQRSRYGSPGGQDYFGQPAPREPVLPVREPMRDPRPIVREQQPTTVVDSFQDARIDSLERAVRDLGVDLADDRKTIRTLVGDLQRTTAAQADDTGRFRGGLTDRLAALEETLLRARNDSPPLPAALLDRIDMIERMIEQRLADLGRNPQVSPVVLDRIGGIERMIDQRLADIGRSQSVSPLLLDRVAGIERMIERVMNDQAIARPVDPSPALLDRLSVIERGLDARLADIGRATSMLADRLQSVEQSAQRPVEATLSPLVSQRLDAITSFGGKVETLERTFQLILDRMTGVESKLADFVEKQVKVDLSVVERRLGEIEGNVKLSAEQSLDMGPVTELLSGIEVRVAGLERTIDNRASETGRTVSFIGERLRSFEETLGGQKGQTFDRFDQIERSLSAYAETSVTARGSYENDLSEVHEALLKLNANQQTLAGALDQWRLDSTGDLSVINNRLKVVEETDLKNLPQLEIIAGQISAIHSTLAKREVRKKTFLTWLFGTDEWYSSSYDTKVWRARQIEPAAPRTGETVVIQQRPTPPAPPPAIVRV